MPFGVELPENLGQTPAADPGAGSPSDGGAPEGSASPEISTKAPGTDSGVGAKAPELTDIDKLERFRFEGREWTPKDLRDARLRQDDYTRKTQELAETRKYVDNFAADLDAVLKDPKLLAAMERIYPKEFVAHAKTVLAKYSGQSVQPKEPSQTATQTNPELDSIKSELAELREERAQAAEERRAQEVEQIQKWLDSTHETLSKKYPMANQEIVNARAEAAVRQKVQITDAVLEKLYKSVHGEIQAKWEETYKGKVNRQLEAGKEARDVGPGGGTPSGAPKKPRNIKEATNAFLEDINAGRSR